MKFSIIRDIFLIRYLQKKLGYIVYLFQMQEDLLNYQDFVQNNTIRPRLRPQVPKNLRNVTPSGNRDTFQSPSTSSTCNQDSNLLTSPPPQQREDKWTLCKPQVHHKSIQVRPDMVHHSVGVNIPKRKGKLHFILKEDVTAEENDPSSIGSTSEFTETEGSSVPMFNELVGRDFMKNLIRNKPAEFLGVPKQYYWIIEYLEKKSKIPSFHIILTLYKIKNNDTFSRMSDIFQVSLATLWRMFYKTLRLLSLFFKQFLYWPTAVNIKRNLPPVFTCNRDYANVQSIIDAFEIEIEKPKKPIDQALTWSQYKQCNTIKYLIGATPDGFINFISEGYGGRISDMNLVEQSGFLEVVPENATILADRGFKHLETHLLQKSVKVLRPPTVTKDRKMTKSEVLDTKVIASLRIHIERVIRRVRLFKLLKPHAVVNNKLVNVLDDAVIVACGLINLQSPILRKI